MTRSVGLARGLGPLAGESLTYGLASALSSFVSMLLLPFFARALSPAEYGAAAVISAILGLTASFTSLGLDAAAARWFYDSTSDARRASIMNTYFWASASTATAATVTVIFFASSISEALGMADSAVLPVRLAAATLAIGVFPKVVSNWFRFLRRSRPAAALLALQPILTSLLSAWFVMGLGLGITGLFLGGAAGAIVAGAIAVAVKPGPFGPRRASLILFRQMLRYGLPLVPASIAVWITASLDRVMLGQMATPEEVGLYTMSVSVALPVALLVTGFGMAWGPYSFSTIESGDTAFLVTRALPWFIYTASLVALVTTTLAEPLLHWLVPSSYWGAAATVPVVAFSTVFVGMGMVMGVGAMLAKNSKIAAASLGLGAGLNVLLNVVLIPAYGRHGAAWATLCSAALACGLTYVLNQRLNRLPFPTARSLAILTLALLAGLSWDESSPASWLLLAIFVSGGFGLSYSCLRSGRPSGVATHVSLRTPSESPAASVPDE